MVNLFCSPATTRKRKGKHCVDTGGPTIVESREKMPNKFVGI